MGRCLAADYNQLGRPHPGVSMSIIEEIRAGNARLNAAISDGDATAIAALYTEDARFLPNGAPKIEGRAGIESFFKQAFDAGFTNLNLETQDVTEAGDLAIEIGVATNTHGTGDVGKYVVVWRRESGVLKIDIDIFNSDSRPE
jgi:uncharacterized protein (TIGR02246 family)